VEQQEQLMPSLDEIMSGKVPGSVKVKRPSWTNGEYFIPYLYSPRDGFWYGLDHEQRHDRWLDTIQDFDIYTAPKPKKTVYEWMYFLGGEGWIIEELLMDEEDARSYFPEDRPFRKTGRSFEVEVEE
jgi:hypothetical protein